MSSKHSNLLDDRGEGRCFGVPAGGWGRRLVIQKVGEESWALPAFLDLLRRVNRSRSNFKRNFVRLWIS